MNKIILTFGQILWITYLFAQKHDFNWVFGDNTGGSLYHRMQIDFNIIPARTVKANLGLNFENHTGSMSDSTGNLLFYTNGARIFDKSHHLMENGDTINPNQFWASDAQFGAVNVVGPFALPYPGHPNQYILFHTVIKLDPDSSYYRLAYLYRTDIDMNANNGLGKVLAKNQIILDGDLGWPAACKHGNGRDWWITCFDLSDAEQITFLLSPQGLSGPFKQQIGPDFSIFSPEMGNCSLFSPDGKKYLRHDGHNGPRIMDFDRCSGLFSNMKIIAYPPNIWSWAASFSPNSRFLYLAKPTVVWKVDLKFANPAISFDTLSRYNGKLCPSSIYDVRNHQLQLAPDNKIYISTFNTSGCMNRIEQPNLPDRACDMAWGGFEKPYFDDGGLPFFPNYRLGENENSPCDTLNFQTPNDGFVKTIDSLNGKSSLILSTKDDYEIFSLPYTPSSSDSNAENEQRDLIRDRFNRRKIAQPTPQSNTEKHE
jgi:hypothetical protein